MTVSNINLTHVMRLHGHKSRRHQFYFNLRFIYERRNIAKFAETIKIATIFNKKPLKTQKKLELEFIY